MELAFGHLIQCASDMGNDVEVKNLFVELRSEENLKKIVKRARSMLAADESFFGVDSDHVRIEGPECLGRIARVFVREAIVPSPSENLTVTDCYARFNEFCEAKGMTPMERRGFKQMISELVKEEFNLCLRHDLVGKNMRMQQGWKGLSARMPVLLDERYRN